MAYKYGHIRQLYMRLNLTLNMSFFEKNTVKSGHSDLKKIYKNIVAKYYQNTLKKKKVIQKIKIWDLMVWCFDGKLYRAWHFCTKLIFSLNFNYKNDMVTQFKENWMSNSNKVNMFMLSLVFMFL